MRVRSGTPTMAARDTAHPPGISGRASTSSVADGGGPAPELVGADELAVIDELLPHPATTRIEARVAPALAAQRKAVAINSISPATGPGAVE